MGKRREKRLNAVELKKFAGPWCQRERDAADGRGELRASTQLRRGNYPGSQGTCESRAGPRHHRVQLGSAA